MIQVSLSCRHPISCPDLASGFADRCALPFIRRCRLERRSTEPTFDGRELFVRTYRLLQCLRLIRCLECFCQDYDLLRLAGSICWLASSDVTGDTLKRACGCGQPTRGVISGLLKNDKRRAPLRSVPFSRDCNRIINFITQICLP